MSTLLIPAILRLAEEGEPHVSHTVSYGIGAIALGILLALLAALLIFGKGREHS